LSNWRADKNAKALDRLLRSLPAAFPAAVRVHALARPLIPATPRRAVESYWRHHPVRADVIARALAKRSGAPDGWAWETGPGRGSFRVPPLPFRDPAHAKGPGHCCVCGQPVYRFGWHCDLWGDGAPNKRAIWHSACVVAWNLWNAPSEHAMHLKRIQKHRCRVTGGRLWKTAEIDHRVPLFRVWRHHRAEPWPVLLGYWGVPNLQVINRPAHVEKCAQEAGERTVLAIAGVAESAG
jgi:hypothetical protein